MNDEAFKIVISKVVGKVEITEVHTNETIN